MLTHPHTRAQGSSACDVKGSNGYTDGSSPASLYQVGSYGSCLSALRSKMICAMEGNFTSKGAPRRGEVKHFQPGTHINQQVPERLRGSQLPIETLLHIHTLIKHKWNAGVNWMPMVAHEDLLELHQKNTTLQTALHAMGLDPDKLPKGVNPFYQACPS